MTSVPQWRNQTAYVTQGNVVDTPYNDGIKRHARAFLILGALQLVLACLSLVFGVANLAVVISKRYNDFVATLSTGIWTSLYFFVSGILGVLQGKKKTRCLLDAALTMTIFSALAASALFGMELTGTLISKNITVLIGIHSVLTFIASAEIVISIVHLAYCCNARCCRNSSTAVASRTTPINMYPTSSNMYPITANTYPNAANVYPNSSNMYPTPADMYSTAANLHPTSANIYPKQAAPIPDSRTTFMKGPPLAPGMMMVHHQYVINTSEQPQGDSYQAPIRKSYVTNRPNIPPPDY